MTNPIIPTVARHFEVVRVLVDHGRLAMNQPGVSGAYAAQCASMAAAARSLLALGLKPGAAAGVDVPHLFHHVAQGLGWRDSWDMSYRMAMPIWRGDFEA